jgi:uncharacterized membrane protein SpoIIM required for sporulation
MVFEDFYRSKWMKHRPYLAFGLGFVFTFVGFAISRLIFSKFLSLATVFMATLFLIPLMLRLIKEEEKLDRKYGLKHFFRNHKDVFEAYVFAFLGLFFGFLLLGMITYGTPTHADLFSFQIDFIEFQQSINVDNLQASIDNLAPTWDNFAELLAHNLVVVILCFILSFFYSASAIFLIILNGSVFAHFITFIIKNLSTGFLQGLQALGAFMLHLIPETAAFLIAAIAGGIASRAVIHEKYASAHFRNVFKDATVLVTIACVLIVLGALIEVFVTTKLFGMLF